MKQQEEAIELLKKMKESGVLTKTEQQKISIDDDGLNCDHEILEKYKKSNREDCQYDPELINKQ